MTEALSWVCVCVCWYLGCVPISILFSMTHPIAFFKPACFAGYSDPQFSRRYVTSTGPPSEQMTLVAGVLISEITCSMSQSYAYRMQQYVLCKGYKCVLKVKRKSMRFGTQPSWFIPGAVIARHHRFTAPPSQSPICLTQAGWGCKPAINHTHSTCHTQRVIQVVNGPTRT